MTTDKTTLLAELEAAYGPYRRYEREITAISLNAVAAICEGHDALPVEYSDQDYTGSLVLSDDEGVFEGVAEDLWGPLSNLNDGNASAWQLFAKFFHSDQAIESLDLAAIREAYRDWTPGLSRPWVLVEVRDGCVEPDSDNDVDIVIIDWDNVGYDRQYADDVLARLDAGTCLPADHVARIRDSIAAVWQDA